MANYQVMWRTTIITAATYLDKLTTVMNSLFFPTYRENCCILRPPNPRSRSSESTWRRVVSSTRWQRVSSSFSATRIKNTTESPARLFPWHHFSVLIYICPPPSPPPSHTHTHTHPLVGILILLFIIIIGSSRWTIWGARETIKCCWLH